MSPNSFLCLSKCPIHSSLVAKDAFGIVVCGSLGDIVPLSPVFVEAFSVIFLYSRTPSPVSGCSSLPHGGYFLLRRSPFCIFVYLQVVVRSREQRSAHETIRKRLDFFLLPFYNYSDFILFLVCNDGIVFWNLRFRLRLGRGFLFEFGYGFDFKLNTVGDLNFYRQTAYRLEYR